MSDSTQKTKLTIVAVVGTLVIVAGILLPMYFFVWKPGTDYPTWDLELSGVTVNNPVNITYEEIREEFTPTNYSFNHTKWWEPNGYLTEIRNYTGVSLWQIIQYSGVDYGFANALRFVANDGWKSPLVSLNDVENQDDLIIIYYMEEGEYLEGPDTGGNGFLMSAVNYSINPSKKSSHFNLKWLVGIEFMIDWEISLFGNDSLIVENTISYHEILTEESLNRQEDVLLNSTYPGVYTEMRNVTGVTLWSIIQYLEIDLVNVTGVRFGASSDGWFTGNISLSDVEIEAEKVLIIYKEDGIFLDPTLDGYIRSIVDFTLTEPDRSGWFSARFMDLIEFLLI